MYSATKSALIGLTGALRAELWDENIRLSTIIPGVVATPISDQMGDPPDFAISPDECARAVLKGLAANDRIVIVADYDVDAAINAFRPDHAQGNVPILHGREGRGRWSFKK